MASIDDLYDAMSETASNTRGTASSLERVVMLLERISDKLDKLSEYENANKQHIIVSPSDKLFSEIKAIRNGIEGIGDNVRYLNKG